MCPNTCGLEAKQTYARYCWENKPSIQHSSGRNGDQRRSQHAVSFRLQKLGDACQRYFNGHPDRLLDRSGNRHVTSENGTGYESACPFIMDESDGGDFLGDILQDIIATTQITNRKDGDG